MRLYDAHNHLQDSRLAPFANEIQQVLSGEPIARMVVNGTSEADWPAVNELARQDERVIPSFGYHPWLVNHRSRNWKESLAQFLDSTPSGVGEIGLDRWIKGHDSETQERMFVEQLRLAASRNLPASIHCLRAWGRLLEILRAEPRPACGFLLHSFGGPRELIPALVDLGAYFSLPGYFAHERKYRQREAFRRVPPERLLIETDAPDQGLPPEWAAYSLGDPANDQPLNHPGNLGAVYDFAAELLDEDRERLAERVEGNFLRLFGGIGRCA